MNLKQLIALMRLRFQLSANQVRKGGQLNSILYSIVSVVILAFAVISFFSAIVMGVILLPNREAKDILLLWNVVVAGFLAMWLFHFVNKVQQNDVISIEKLLHLPMTFRGAFLLNYLSTFANLTFLTFAPLIIGLAIAMPFARGPASAVAIPLSLSFLFMVTAITWQLRSWMSAKLQNRRTRGLFMAFFPFAVGALAILVTRIAESSSVNILKDLQLGWLPSGVVAAESGNWVPGVLGSSAMMAIGSAALVFACRSSIKKVTGDTRSGGAKKSKAVSVDSNRWIESWMFTKLPGLSVPVSAVAMGTIHSFRRAPELFAALVPLIVLTIFGTPYLLGWEGYVVAAWIPSSLPIGLIAVALLGFPAFLFTTFSYDRDGFRAFILSPVERADILVGRNIGIVLPTILLGWITMIVAQCFFPVGIFWWLGSMICLVPCCLGVAIAGNIVSTFFPVGLKRGSMTPVNARIIPVVVLYLGIFVGPFLSMLPTCGSSIAVQMAEKYMEMPMGWLYFLLAIVQLFVVWLVYRKSLSVIGDSLWRNESELLFYVANIPD